LKFGYFYGKIEICDAAAQSCDDKALSAYIERECEK